MRALPWAAAVLVILIASLAAADAARADGGEAGLVIQHGDGVVETFCVPFSGDGIRGDELLRRAGVTAEQFGGLVCSLGTRPSEGCHAASSFESCTCQCQGANCVYWAFFTQGHGGQWIYSALGLTVQKAKDGDLQGWKWGKGSASSAPAPAPITFEQVCGHAPRGGPVAATATPPPVTATPGSDGATPPAASTEVPAGGSAVPTRADIEHLTVLPGTGAPAAVTPLAAATAATGAPGQSNGGGTGRSLFAFGLVAAVLFGAIGMALLRRRARGS